MSDAPQRRRRPPARSRLALAGMGVPGGIRVKLIAALAGIVGGALLAAYLIVVPSLERRLVDAKLDQLHGSASTVASALVSTGALSNPLSIDGIVRGYGNALNARVVLFQVYSSPLTLGRASDSAESTSDAITKDPVALEAARTGAPTQQRVQRRGEWYAEAAVPLLATRGLVLVSASLADQLATVRLVKRRMLSATVAGLAIALSLGLIAASLHARRIRRLQRAAERIAQGRFDEPVADLSTDELGQLTRAFERMRVQVAQLDSARKEFVANASHELRTPLFSLAGFLELLTDEELDEETRREFLTTTRGQVERLTRLATDLLDLSRLDAGRFRVEAEEVGLAEVARVLAEELQALAEASGHQLEVEVDDEAWVHADEERVLQIGRALARNAIVHTPSGTRVTIRAERRGLTAALVVEDDGPGIPAEHAERVFQRFYRVEGGHASGSGLGLAIARELAGRMGGSVDLESRSGRTVFVVSLPAEPPVTVAAGRRA